MLPGNTSADTVDDSAGAVVGLGWNRNVVAPSIHYGSIHTEGLVVAAIVRNALRFRTVP